MSATPKTPVWFVLTRHWLSLLGAFLVTTAVVSMLFVAPQEIRGHADNPYVGIVFLILPFVFFAGLALIPIGVYLSKRQIREGMAASTFDRGPALRRLAWFLGLTGALNVLIGTQLTVRAVKHMETPQFCGATCHSMAPEFAAHQNAPHSRIECVECHVAPGASGWIQSKTSGMRQLMETVMNTASKPIPSALESNRLVPNRETCENCHWPQRFVGVRLRVFSKFASDEKNTRTETVLLMKVGGLSATSIHGAHLGPGVSIQYGAQDAARQKIPWVEYRNTTTGVTRTFNSADAAKGSENGLHKFEMQCVDCHNRPTHSFDLPDRALDRALAIGEISTGLPFIKKTSLELLQANYATSEEAAAKIPAGLTRFYQDNYSEVSAKRTQDIEQAGKAVLAIYNRNVFPDLKVTWGTYANNLGHMDFPGCFRCHDGNHATASGDSIAQDCSTCHEALATEETSPEILKTLGIADTLAKAQRQ